ncbi:Cro/Cl family transcriptional regulator [Enterococcus florum]|uniref:Cro/Cl family transcriptional regulator n=1 Tax=Enterococcus florum TaxID=2480627 RepID=A0A4P5P975_9ENTE|nr:XRE family transcriptional regulator [Enterococcus florum]GCF94450.1 Cro/Cl family transcriptional regulator [Enterococcus florum]
MEIGEKLKNLRIQKNLTQEELGERTDLSKGYISQLERDLSSPSMETFFDILEVLGVTPEEFFSQKTGEQKVLYTKEDTTFYTDETNGYHIKWLIPESNENEMEPILLTLEKTGQYKQFAPSLSETFIYVLEGTVHLQFGDKEFIAKAGDSMYYEASKPHRLQNHGKELAKVLLVATDSYL